MSPWEFIVWEILEEVKTKGKSRRDTTCLHNLGRVSGEPNFDWEKWAEENSLWTSLLELPEGRKIVVYREFYRKR